MIICSCHVISDHEVETAFAAPEAPQTMSQVYRQLGHEPHCGRCVRTIRDMMKDGGDRRSR
jgi:bacterioferritin-associated ferredoxin